MKEINCLLFGEQARLTESAVDEATEEPYRVFVCQLGHEIEIRVRDPDEGGPMPEPDEELEVLKRLNRLLRKLGIEVSPDCRRRSDADE